MSPHRIRENSRKTVWICFLSIPPVLSPDCWSFLIFSMEVDPQQPHPGHPTFLESIPSWRVFLKPTTCTKKRSLNPCVSTTPMRGPSGLHPFPRDTPLRPGIPGTDEAGGALRCLDAPSPPPLFGAPRAVLDWLSLLANGSHFFRSIACRPEEKKGFGGS